MKELTAVLMPEWLLEGLPLCITMRIVYLIPSLISVACPRLCDEPLCHVW